MTGDGCFFGGGGETEGSEGGLGKRVGHATQYLEEKGIVSLEGRCSAEELALYNMSAIQTQMQIDGVIVTLVFALRVRNGS